MDQAVVNSRDQVTSLLQEAYAIRISDLNLSAKLGEEALAISRGLADNELIGKSLNQLSLFYMIMGQHALSAAMAEEAIDHFKELNDEKGIADAKYNLAGIYYKTDNFHLGLIYLIDCLTIYKKFDDYHNQARVHKSLGTIYEFLGDRKNAVKSYEASIETAKKAGDPSLKSNAYNPLSGIYLKEGKIAEALEIIEKSITIKKEAGDTRGLAFALYGRAKVYTKTKQYTQAESDFIEALKIHESVGERLGTGMAYRKLAELYMAMGELQRAKSTLLKALDIANEYNIAMIRFKSNYHLYEICKTENDTINALNYLEQYLKQKEAVINTQTLQVIENYELITKMESLEKEAQLQQEKAEIIEKKNLAEQASKIKQDFLSTMSHEIRTPLNAVITISSLLQDKADPEEQELLNSLRFAGNNLLMLVNDILDFTRLDFDKTTLELHPADIRHLLENLIKTYESLAKEKGLKLFLRIDSEIAGSYKLDDTKISQIIGNILGNAIKYTERGKIEIDVEKIGETETSDQLHFSIKDTGAGIAEDFIPQIFDSFSQPKSHTTRKQGGSGLGLAIVKKLADLHNTTVYVKSTVGQGSEFYFVLELKRSDTPIKTLAITPDKIKGKTVLLAEDNVINAMVAIKLLSNWGVTTVHAKNGIETVEKAKLKNFDFILMDIHMPEMNGFDAAKNIRLNENLNKNTPIFALTADITAEQQEEYVSYFNTFLRKPIDIDKLFEALSKVE
jgi:signal transduction histidine kinase/ActR/RegA family two-component response regulator